MPRVCSPPRPETLDVPNVPTVLILISFAVGGSLLWMQIRRRRVPALAAVERGNAERAMRACEAGEWREEDL